jgi:hypothetical protein
MLNPIISPALDLSGVRHGFFTRGGGVSEGLYAGLNCGLGSKDDPARVLENRARVARHLGGAHPEVLTVYQVHSGTAVRVAGPIPREELPKADAVVTAVPGLVIGVLTADCTPVLFADPEAKVVAAAHAGWRGAVAGVLEATIAAMEALGAKRGRIAAAVGPCIGQDSYEVAADLHDAVLANNPADARFFAEGRRPERWQFDLAGYCAHRLRAAGTGTVAALGLDTLALEAQFFSHRRRTLAGGGPIGHQMSIVVL